MISQPEGWSLWMSVLTSALPLILLPKCSFLVRPHGQCFSFCQSHGERCTEVSNGYGLCRYAWTGVKADFDLRWSIPGSGTMAYSVAENAWNDLELKAGLGSWNSTGIRIAAITRRSFEVRQWKIPEDFFGACRAWASGFALWRSCTCNRPKVKAEDSDAHEVAPLTLFSSLMEQGRISDPWRRGCLNTNLSISVSQVVILLACKSCESQH